jgi:hypothetical protein
MAMAKDAKRFRCLSHQEVIRFSSRLAVHRAVGTLLKCPLPSRSRFGAGTLPSPSDSAVQRNMLTNRTASVQRSRTKQPTSPLPHYT